jgi:hypothetical protein
MFFICEIFVRLYLKSTLKQFSNVQLQAKTTPAMARIIKLPLLFYILLQVNNFYSK